MGEVSVFLGLFISGKCVHATLSCRMNKKKEEEGLIVKWDLCRDTSISKPWGVYQIEIVRLMLIGKKCGAWDNGKSRY